ncbi:MAG TPA: hypothetical protein VFM56_09780 [Solimonas sp.]|nr:hypothetical protein [Solimonas sp.]
MAGLRTHMPVVPQFEIKASVIAMPRSGEAIQRRGWIAPCSWIASSTFGLLAMTNFKLRHDSHAGLCRRGAVHDGVDEGLGDAPRLREPRDSLREDEPRES